MATHLKTNMNFVLIFGIFYPYYSVSTLFKIQGVGELWFAPQAGADGCYVKLKARKLISVAIRAEASIPP
jgi:hypothetical protein